MSPTVTQQLYLEPFNRSQLGRPHDAELAEDYLEEHQHVGLINSHQHRATNDNDPGKVVSESKAVAKRNMLIEIIQSILNYLSQIRTNGNKKQKHEPEAQKQFCDEVSVECQEQEQMMELEDEIVEFSFNQQRCESFEEAGERSRVLLVTEKDSMAVTLSSSSNRMRVALGVLIRLLLPVANRLSQGFSGLRAENLLRIINRVRETRGLLTTLLAYTANTVAMSLSSLQVSNRFDPLLRVIKLKRDSVSSPTSTSPLLSPSDSISSFDSLSSSNFYSLSLQRSLSITQHEPTEKCVSCVVLTEPPPGEPIKYDVIFIHGLHGSLVNTWKQGLWTSEGKLDHFRRPPKPPIRPPKRQRHSRSTLVVPAQKRARYCDSFDIKSSDEEMSDTFELKHKSTILDEDEGRMYTFDCGEPDDIQYMDDVEYSFPTFRLRVDDIENNEPVKLTHHKAGKQPKPKKDENYSPCWPRDWLPMDCPGVRVIAINYTTDPYLWRPLWVKKRNRSGLIERSREMQEMLIEKEVGKGHPIVWVGHSKGGIFIKQMIVDAWESGRAAAKDLFYSSRGCFFYSVPHRGSSLADFNLPLLRQSLELMEIQKDCSSILDLHGRFVALYRAGHLKVDVFSFVETALTLMSVLYLRIVTIDSADPGIGEVCGVHLDHREICKPRSRDCFLYTELVKLINNVKY